MAINLKEKWEHIISLNPEDISNEDDDDQDIDYEAEKHLRLKRL